MTRGERLYRLRKSRELTLGEAAEKIGVNKSTLYRYEQDEFAPASHRVEERLCGLYRTGPECLGMVREEPAYPGSEEWILPAYRSLGERDQLRVRNLLRRGGGGEPWGSR